MNCRCSSWWPYHDGVGWQTLSKYGIIAAHTSIGGTRGLMFSSKIGIWEAGGPCRCWGLPVGPYAACGPPHVPSYSKRPSFVIVRGLWCKGTLVKGTQNRLVSAVPTKCRSKLMNLAHEHPRGHVGVKRSRGNLQKSVHWEEMGKDDAWSCEVCQRAGKHQKPVKAHPDNHKIR